MKFRAVTNNKRQLDLNWEVINAYLSKWRPGTPIDIEIKRRVKKTSDPMRAYYFSAVLPPFMEQLGYDKEETELFHRQLKIVYFQIQPDKKGIYRKVPSVFSNEPDVRVPEQAKFVEWVIRAAAKEGVYIEPAS